MIFTRVVLADCRRTQQPNIPDPRDTEDEKILHKIRFGALDEANSLASVGKLNILIEINSQQLGVGLSKPAASPC